MRIYNIPVHWVVIPLAVLAALMLVGWCLA